MSSKNSMGSFLDKLNKVKKTNADVEYSGSTTGAIAKAMETRPDMTVSKILVSEIYTEKQVREVNNDKVLEYASSIRGSEDGQPLQPITVWQNPDGGYLVIIGEHRYRAQLHNFENHGKKYESIYAIVRTGECPQGSDRRRIQLQENLQQNPMSDIEIALVVRDEMAAGTFSTVVDAVKWLHVDGVDGGRSAGTVRNTLNQVFALLDNPDAVDLVEAVHKGEMKPYKAKQILDQRKREAREAEQANVISLQMKRSNDRIAELEAELEKSRSIIQQVEEMGEGEDFDIEGVEDYQDADELISAEQERQIDIEEQIEIEKAKAEKAEKATNAKAVANKPAAAVRFSLERDDALLVLDLLADLARVLGLEELTFDAEGLSRKQWDSIFKERVPEIIEAALEDR